MSSLISSQYSLPSWAYYSALRSFLNQFEEQTPEQQQTWFDKGVVGLLKDFKLIPKDSIIKLRDISFAISLIPKVVKRSENYGMTPSEINGCIQSYLAATNSEGRDFDDGEIMAAMLCQPQEYRIAIDRSEIAKINAERVGPEI